VRSPPNKALQLTRRRRSSCPGYQPAVGRAGGRFAGRPPDVSSPSTGGAQLSALSVRRRRQVGVVKRLPEVESWLSVDAASWEPLSDPAYRSLVRGWKLTYIPLIEARRSLAKGPQALDIVAKRLSGGVVLFSGVHVPEVGNLGGSCAAGYHALGLTRLNVALVRRSELLVAASDLTWSCLFSHETGSMFYEELYEASESAA